MRPCLPILAGFLLITACAFHPGPEEGIVYTRFTPMGGDEAAHRYEYAVLANDENPQESETAEQARKLWLASYLAANGWSMENCRIRSRECRPGPKGREQIVYLIEVQKVGDK